MSTDDESVEQWARSHHFSEPLRLAEVEVRVRARWWTFSDHDRRAWSQPGLRKVAG